MPMTKPQAEALARLVHELRPDWDAAGVFCGLKPVAGRPEFDICLAAIRAAADPGARTPGVIASDGPHWRERIPTEQRVPRGPQPHEECGKHPGQFQLSCSGCRSERLAQAAPEERVVMDRAAALEAARHQLSTTRQGFCSHGVPPERCAEHDPRKTETEETR